MLTEPGKLNILIDGQFGSTGKGLLAAYIATMAPADFYLSSLSPNAGHTFPLNGEQVVVKQIPVGGIINRRSTIYLTAGSILDVAKLTEEVARFDIDAERLFIHPRATIIEAEDIAEEVDENSSVAKIASTQSGVGAALARKVMRSARVAADVEELAQIATVQELDIMGYLDHGLTACMETSQGFDLSIDSGLSYPHCTSREITVSAQLAYAQVHPAYLGKVSVCLRTYPIRVGHIEGEGGELIGHSGPFYQDSDELTWDELSVTPEKTTVTGRVRRVATFSIDQYERMLKHIRPDTVFLNFANYTRPEELETFKQVCKVRTPDLVGVGRELEQIYPVGDYHQAFELIKVAAGEKVRHNAGLTGRAIHTI